jgi:hypothetical protein
MSAKCIAYDQFVNFRISYPSSAGCHFAVCLHHSALVDCAGGSTCVAVVAFPSICPPVFLVRSGLRVLRRFGYPTIYGGSPGSLVTWRYSVVPPGLAPCSPGPGDKSPCPFSVVSSVLGPTGEQKTAQGFSPGNDTHKEIALKGRPNGIDYNVYICCYMQWLSPFHI